MITALILSDDKDLVAIVGLFLGVAGFECVSSDDTDQALAQLRDGSIDLLVIFSRLPGGKHWAGIYDLMKTDHRLRDIGVILLWASSGVPHKDIYAEGDAFIGVPFPGEDLPRIVARVLAHRGKQMPPAKELTDNFTRNRARLEKETGYSGRDLVKLHGDLLQKAGYTAEG